MKVSVEVPICRHCRRAIWRHRGIWRHFYPGAYMLCQPDEEAPDFTGIEVAEPSVELVEEEE